MKNVLDKLNKIQVELKAPKSQFNKFGNYKYRNCEDILEALKPLANKYKVVVLVSDEVVKIEERYYIKATATLLDVESGESIASSAFAREEESKKGMDSAQLTGSTSSYARKYALNGLLAIDDSKDSDDYVPTDTNKPKNANKEQTRLDRGRMNAEMMKIVNDNKISAKTVSALTKSTFKKEKTSDLTDEELLELINALKRLANGIGA